MNITSFSELTTPYILPVDEECFSIRIARVKNINEFTLSNTLDYCYHNNIKLLIARCNTSNILSAQLLEKEGFLLMDALLYYKRDISTKKIPILKKEKIIIRPIEAGEDSFIQQIARDAFCNYNGHYHADKRLNKEASTNAYISWALNCCRNRNIATEVLVAEVENKIVGFAALKKYTDEVEGLLYAVNPSTQRQGIYHSLMLYSMRWSLAQDVKYFIYSTQLTNIAAQKVLVRIEAEPFDSYYTFHKWFD